jgi:hypothetical protein
MADPHAYLHEQLRREQRLLEAITAHLPALEALARGFAWSYEDRRYRFYSQSWKVYELQGFTTQAVDLLQQIAQEVEGSLHPWLTTMTAQGTGIQFAMEHNQEWLTQTRPMVEAFLHATYFVEMAITRTQTMDTVQPLLPLPWAAMLTLYTQR